MACALLGATAAAAVGDALAQGIAAAGLDAPRGHEYEGQYSSGMEAMAAQITNPDRVEGGAPEMGVWRTARYAAVVGVLAGAAGEVWFRRLLVSFPGFTYDVALRTLVDQVRLTPPLCLTHTLAPRHHGTR